MGILDFARKQLVDVLEWLEVDDETLAWRFPLADHEIQQGAQLVVRETQAAVFVHEGRVADVFGPGRHDIRTGNLPVLSDLAHWDKGFESPIKSDVVFVSTRLRQSRTWGTPAPITVRDRELGVARIRAFGVFGYHVAAPATLFTRVVGSRDVYAATELEAQVRAALVTALATRLGMGDVAFVDLASRQDTLADDVRTRAAQAFADLGLALDAVRIESFSVPETVEARLDERSGMGVLGDLGAYARFQAARAIPDAATAGGVAGAGVGMGVGVAMGQAMHQALSPGAPAPAGAPCAACGAAPPAGAHFCSACGAPLS